MAGWDFILTSTDQPLFSVMFFLLVPDVLGRAGVSLCDKIICTMAPPIFCIYVIVYRRSQSGTDGQ